MTDTDRALDAWLDLMVKPSHRAYALSCLRRMLDKSLTDAQKRQMPLWKGDVSTKAAEAIFFDAGRFVRNVELYWYADYRKRMVKAARKRKATMQYRKENGLARPRDSQRQKLYTAETVISHDGIGRIETVPEMQAYVDRLTSSAWFQRRWKIDKITVGDGRRSRRARAHYYRMMITMPKWARCESIVLHEIAHLCTDRRFGYDNVPAHGREYAAILLELVRHQMGDEAWRKLRDSFRKRKVRFTQPRTLTPEQRAAASERLIAARAAKAAA